VNYEDHKRETLRPLFEEMMGFRDVEGQIDIMVPMTIEGKYQDPFTQCAFDGFLLAHSRIPGKQGHSIADVLDQMIAQRKKGIAKYGQGIEDNGPLTARDLIQHAFEEACDQVVYLAECLRRLA
jgi:hypothetical protein